MAFEHPATASIETQILTIRGRQVLLDVDLARVYGVSTKSLNQAAKRNADRFPEDFRFRITLSERDKVVTICDHLTRLKFSSTMPWAYTEHGAIMAASVLNSPRAVDMSVFVVRAFVRLRSFATRDLAIAKQLGLLERRVTRHDRSLEQVFDVLRRLLRPPGAPQRRIGF